MTVNSRLPGFSELSPRERFEPVVAARGTGAEALADLRTGPAGRTLSSGATPVLPAARPRPDPGTRR
jgi:hypothetical protein